MQKLISFIMPFLVGALWATVLCKPLPPDQRWLYGVLLANTFLALFIDDLSNFSYRLGARFGKWFSKK